MTIKNSPSGAAFDLPLAEGRVRARCLASQDTDWSLKDLYVEGDEERNPELVSFLRKEFSLLGITRAYAPSVASMSGAIVSRSAFTSRIPLGDGMDLYRNRELQSDGTWLSPGDAFVMSGGGCPVAIAEGGGLCLVAHVGRESAINRERLLGGKPKRGYMSVINEMALNAYELGVSPDTMMLSVLFQIPTSLFGHPLDDPEHGNAHRAILRYAEELGDGVASVHEGRMHLNMHRLVMEQGRQAGFKINDVNYELPEAGPFGHTRHPDPKLRPRRNLVTVQYR